MPARSRTRGSNEQKAIDSTSSKQRKLTIVTESHHIDHAEKANLQGDYVNISVLVFLYVLQGIPLGLIGSVPYILTNRGVTYSQQALFSFVTWPFSLKLLWAPIVDSLYIKRFGRRKSWLVPVQYLIGVFMIVISNYIETLISAQPGPPILLLTGIFLLLNLLAATQDIAVDGWALTMLQPKNVAYASTCNTVGQTAGYFLGYVVFLALESPDFANNYIRSQPQPHGLVDLQGFFYFWGVVFLITTTLTMIFKHENQDCEGGECMSVSQTYAKLWQLVKLDSVKRFAIILLTCKIGFAVTDAATGLKLIEAGVHKENLALLVIPLTPMQIILTWTISQYTNGPKPLNIFLAAFPLRLLFGFIFSGLILWTSYLKTSENGFPLYYYAVVLILYVMHQILACSMFVALMSFHAKISDPLIGGTYMTFLNTITNLGGNWPMTLSLYLIDWLTFTSCSVAEDKGASCKPNHADDWCSRAGGVCSITLDGYYIETVVCTLIGLGWYFWGSKQIHKIQSAPPSAWRTRGGNVAKKG